MCVIDRSKIELIYNWSDKKKVFPVSKEKNNFLIDHNFSDKKILLYPGTMGSTHNIEDILIAANDLRHHKDILFLFIGFYVGVFTKERYLSMRNLLRSKFHF